MPSFPGGLELPNASYAVFVCPETLGLLYLVSVIILPRF